MSTFKRTAAGLLLASVALANADFTKKTGKKCVYCHEGAWSSGKFTEAGLYYKQHNTLKGYTPKEQPAPAAQNSGKPATK